MTVVTKLATININGITNRTRVGMLTEYIRRHDLDIVFLREITDPELLTMPGYDMYYNNGSHRRGTAIVARNGIALTNINKIPSGKAIAVEYKCLHIVNIYAPSDTAKRAEREHFYNAEVPQLLQTGHGKLIIGGDFSFVTNPADTSGNFYSSRALTEMIRGLHLADAWTQDTARPAYTHYFTTGASRIDRIYVTRNITSRITGIDILPAAFTDHNTVVLRLALGEIGARRCHPRWKLDPTMLRDVDLLSHLRQQWSGWKANKSWYPNVNIWWDRYVKPRLQRYLRIWGAERRRDCKILEDHLYNCIYDIKKETIL